MIRHNTSPDDDELRRRLRREAMETRPAFSETLHRQIVAAMPAADSFTPPPVANQADRDVCIVGRSRPALRVAVWAAGALTAACLLCAIVWMHHPAEPAPSPNVAKTHPAPRVPTNDGRASEEDLSPGSAPPAAAIEHDTRLVAETLLRRLPIDVQLEK
jgi:hypothetical protein